MAWVDLTKPSVGEATKKVSFADGVIDDLVYLKANMGGSGSGGGASAIPNGGFELDGNSDGIPDGWSLTEYTAGAFALDIVTPGSGARGIKFTSPGASGGGDLQSTDFFPVSPRKMLVVDFLTWASNAALCNKVEVRWYSTALEADYIATSGGGGGGPAVYDSVANPTAPTRFVRIAIPPSTARFAKLKLIGADTSTTEVGSSYFDSVSVSEGLAGGTPVSIAEISTGTSATGTATLPLPALSANGLVRVTFLAESHGAAGISDVHFGIGAFLSNAIAGASGGTYVASPFVIHYAGAGGDVTLTCYISTDTGTIYARMVNVPVLIEILTP